MKHRWIFYCNLSVSHREQVRAWPSTCQNYNRKYPITVIRPSSGSSLTPTRLSFTHFSMSQISTSSTSEALGDADLTTTFDPIRSSVSFYPRSFLYPSVQLDFLASFLSPPLTFKFFFWGIPFTDLRNVDSVFLNL